MTVSAVEKQSVSNKTWSLWWSSQIFQALRSGASHPLSRLKKKHSWQGEGHHCHLRVHAYANKIHAVGCIWRNPQDITPASPRLHPTTGHSSSVGGIMITGPPWTTETSQELHLRLRAYLTTSDHELSLPLAAPILLVLHDPLQLLLLLVWFHLVHEI